MTDNKNKPGSPDNKRIDIKDANEVRNWCKSFGVTPAELKKAVEKAGTGSAAVKKALGK